MDELRALRASLSPIEGNFLVTELRQRMSRAERGELIGPGLEDAVGQMGVAPKVLELRMQSRRTNQNQRRHVRLYFTEPDTWPGMLLALHLAWKEDHPMGRAQQDSQALLAQARAEAHIEWLESQPPRPIKPSAAP